MIKECILNQRKLFHAAVFFLKGSTKKSIPHFFKARPLAKPLSSIREALPLALKLIFLILPLGFSLNSSLAMGQEVSPQAVRSCLQSLHEASKTTGLPNTDYEQWLTSTNVVVFNDIYSPFGELSNSFPSPIAIQPAHAEHPLLAKTVEHYFHSQKFRGTISEQQILDLKTPDEAIQEGQDIQRPLRKDWPTVREKIMKEALQEKFHSKPELASRLLETRKKYLIFHSDQDAYWGDGGDGHGQNRLGELLMELRKELSIENETYRYKANAIVSHRQIKLGPASLNRPDFVFPSLGDIKYFSQESRDLIDRLAFNILGTMSEKALSQLDGTIQIGNTHEFRVLLNIINPSLQEPSLRNSRDALRLQNTLRTSLWLSLKYYKPEILKELLSLEVFDEESLFEAKEPSGLNAFDFALAMGHQDLFDMLIANTKQATPVIHQNKIDSYFRRFPFVAIKGLGREDIATGVVTEEMHARIMDAISNHKPYRALRQFETLNINGHLITPIIPDGPFLGNPDELESFLKRVNQLAQSKDPEDQKLLSVIDPERDLTKTYYYEPITEDQFHGLIKAFQLASGDSLWNHLEEQNLWGLNPYILTSENGELSHTLRSVQPLLISQKGKSFPIPFYGILGLPLYCMKNTPAQKNNFNVFNVFNAVSVQWGLSNNIQNKKLVFQSLPHNSFRQPNQSALLLRRIRLEK